VFEREERSLRERGRRCERGEERRKEEKVGATVDDTASSGRLPGAQENRFELASGRDRRVSERVE
jgi:hypothetical protein